MIESEEDETDRDKVILSHDSSVHAVDKINLADAGNHSRCIRHKSKIVSLQLHFLCITK